MQQQPLVSVGIPSYSRPEGLRRTLECITRQTYRHLEIIVSDNCSPGDATEQVVREFIGKDPRVRYYRQKKNIGAVNNFGYLLEQSAGAYFMWAADDDAWEPEYIHAMLELLEKDESASVAFSFFDVHDTATGNVTDRYNDYLLELPSDDLYTRLKQFLLQPVEHGKANIIYGLMSRETALAAWRSVIGKQSGKIMPWAIDILFVFYLLSRGNLAIERVILTHTSQQPDSVGNQEIDKALSNKLRLYKLLRNYYHGFRKTIRVSEDLDMKQKKQLYQILSGQQKESMQWMVFKPFEKSCYGAYIQLRTRLSRYKRKAGL
ncbi:glycosyltransferase family 2 protein [Mariprofundus ferrooxydans]|uniref:Putative glycosly transferase n=1 Tax=Mariprofundus ferrooxydans PV-1 TaxID=314345 RepID=Q0EZ95_9PROT|nr:glycosyltransferase family 2 protein [Mariprofundus ferrooxydans]EAU54529.1 putative glycosly transferase [Mariprofundus ferrooxydans PV-1]